MSPFADKIRRIRVRGDHGLAQSRRGQFLYEHRRDVGWLAAICVLLLASCLFAARWGLPDGATAQTTGTWAVDTVAPVQPLNEAYNRFTRAGSDVVIYPLFHYVVLAGAYAPFVAWAFLTGRLQAPSGEFPYGATDPEGFFAMLTWVASLISALMACGTIVAVHLMTRDLFGAAAARYAALLAALIAPLSYYGGMANLDVPYLFWTSLALWQLVRAALRGALRHYLLCAVFAALATATKDQAAGFFIVLPLLMPALVWLDRRRRSLNTGVAAVALDARLWASAATVLVAFALANNLLFGGWDGFQRHLDFVDRFYEANLAGGVAEESRGVLASLLHSARLLCEVGGPVLPVLALAGLALAVRERAMAALVVPTCALGYYIAVILPTVAISRYLLGVAILAAPFAGFAIARAFAQPRLSVRIAGVAALVLAVLWQGALLLHLHGTLNADSRYAMEHWIRQHVPPGTALEAYTQARYLPRLADGYRYEIVGNSFSAVSYDLRGEELTMEGLRARDPKYILLLIDSRLSGDPTRVANGPTWDYFAALLNGSAGYERVARFETPALLPYRQIHSGTQPISMLLARVASSEHAEHPDAAAKADAAAHP